MSIETIKKKENEIDTIEKECNIVLWTGSKNTATFAHAR